MKLKSGSIKRSLGTLILAMVAALLFRSLLFEPFHIPSGSMKSTLLVGDYVFVSKYTYGYSRYSFPFLSSVFKGEGRILSSQPKAGDVVVFRPPKEDNINYIKRVIGLPGDKVQLKGGLLYINGVKMQYRRISDFVDFDLHGKKRPIIRYEETLYNGKSYAVLDELPNSALDNTAIYTVPKGHFFVLGDNRDNSRDSRYISDLGFIPMDNIIGKACVVVVSFAKSEGTTLPFTIRSDRFWHSIN